MPATPWTHTAEGVMLDVRVMPRSARAPIEDEANEALRKFVAKALGIAPRAAARLKRLRIADDAPALSASLERLTAKVP
jgi:uncharacterized protein YggU (UPF0235/DUF167 family)